MQPPNLGNSFFKLFYLHLCIKRCVPSGCLGNGNNRILKNLMVELLWKEKANIKFAEIWKAVLFILFPLMKFKKIKIFT